MKTNFKPLGLVAAVAAASAGYAGVVNATASVAAETELGDLAIVPYYTVLDGYSTGVNIINSSDRTQVLKFRFRRAVDSMDALDFNVVLSPRDMYTGFIGKGAGDKIFWTSNDNSCVAPSYGNLTAADNQFELPPLYSIGAETGYIEIISMGTPLTETAPIAVSAKHDAEGVPADCGLVRDNFFANGDQASTTKGVINSAKTHQGSPAVVSEYEAAPDSLKVSYFIKSDETGVEFGDNAVHIAGFLDTPAMTNQQTGLFSADLQGFDYPDLNGGSPLDVLLLGVDSRGKYNDLRSILAASNLINDWSNNSVEALGATVDTDWVVTFPGQYVMLDLATYLLGGGIAGTSDVCVRDGDGDVEDGTVDCDYRDIPVTATFNVYDREEQGIIIEEGELVVSPSPPVTVPPEALKDEVNVIQWGDAPVLNAPTSVSVSTPEGAKFGWASLSTVSSDNLALCDLVWDFTDIDPETGAPAGNYECSIEATGSVPVVGFAAWQRAFAANPGSNYGRIVDHSRTQASASM
ncbi:hypothetical protein EYC87_00995 [Halieaceae bacterium IMCC8485]|uniref:Uncharacterized protein n=1 Tax=Candidatus Seongchinamella marina TaxID=2518990 RepID=A0ABT3SQC8_9GAMM|nr:hypothetical protein [Candidatus Seongchinamella marina]MCX2972161.1 hypothetical protein [Candidatus Seongchinamella marina]